MVDSMNPSSIPNHPQAKPGISRSAGSNNIQRTENLSPADAAKKQKLEKMLVASQVVRPLVDLSEKMEEASDKMKPVVISRGLSVKHGVLNATLLMYKVFGPEAAKKILQDSEKIGISKPIKEAALQNLKDLPKIIAKVNDPEEWLKDLQNSAEVEFMVNRKDYWSPEKDKSMVGGQVWSLYTVGYSKDEILSVLKEKTEDTELFEKVEEAAKTIETRAKEIEAKYKELQKQQQKADNKTENGGGIINMILSPLKAAWNAIKGIFSSKK